MAKLFGAFRWNFIRHTPCRVCRPNRRYCLSHFVAKSRLQLA